MQKRPIFLLLFFVLTSIYFGCKNAGSGSELQPFEANFYTVLTSLEKDTVGTKCSPPLIFINTQEGEGTASLIGDFTTRLIFCVNPETMKYDDVQGSFVGKNGDEIFISGGGQIRPTKKPDYDLKFMDSLSISGGTGLFKGATGFMKTTSYVNMETNRTDHIWTGKITLEK